jgi:hypothetical protein
MTEEASPTAVAAAAAVEQAEAAGRVEEAATDAVVSASDAETAAETAAAAAEVTTVVADAAVTEAAIASDTASAADETANTVAETVVAVAHDSENQHAETRSLAQTAHDRIDALETMIAERAASATQEAEAVPVTEGGSDDSGSGRTIEQRRRHKFGR